MFRKTYDSLSMGVHVELLVDAEKICLKTWLETDKLEYDTLVTYNDEFTNAWKKSPLGSSVNFGNTLNKWTLDEIKAGKAKRWDVTQEPQKEIEVDAIAVEVERSLDIPKSPSHMEWPPEVAGIYHRYLPCGRIMGKVYTGEELLEGMIDPYKTAYTDKLSGKYFMGNSFSWIDLTDPSIAGGEKTDGACWVIGVGFDGWTRPAYNATSREFSTKAHPLRSARQYGAPACLFVYQPFAGTPLNECSITLKYNKGYGFSTNLTSGWTDGTTELELFNTSGTDKAGKDYNYVGQLAEAFPKFVVTSGGGTVAADAIDTVEFKMVDNDGATIEKECELYLQSSGGYLPKTRIKTTSAGLGTFKTHALGLETGDRFKVKIGFRNFTGITDVEYVIS